MGQVVSSHAQEDMRVAQHVLKRTTDDLVAELLDATELAQTFPDRQGASMRFTLKEAVVSSASAAAASAAALATPKFVGPLFPHLLTTKIACCKLDGQGDVLAERELTIVQFYRVYFRLLEMFSSTESLFKSSMAHPFDKAFELGSNEPAAEECIICMDANAQVSLSCSHAYCEACIRNWSLSSSQCPICRRESCRTDDSWILTETPTTSDMVTDVHKLVETL